MSVFLGVPVYKSEKIKKQMKKYFRSRKIISDDVGRANAYPNAKTIVDNKYIGQYIFI